MSWFSPDWNSVAHSHSLTPQPSKNPQNQKKKVEYMGWDKNSSIGQQRKRK